MIKILLLLTVLLLNCSEEDKTKHKYLANSGHSPILHSITVIKEKDKTICKYSLKERSTINTIFQIEEIVFYCDKPDFDLIGKKVKLKFEEDK